MTTVESLPEHGRTREVLVPTLEGDVFRQLEAGCAAMEQDPLGPDTTSAAALLREVMYATTEQGEQVNEACVHARRKMVFLESIRLAPMYPRAAEMVMVLAGQEPTLLSAEEWVALVGDTVWRTDIPTEIHDRIRESFSLAFVAHDMGDAFVSALDFTNPAHYAKTAALLEFLGQWYNTLDEVHMLRVDAKEKVRAVLERAVVAEEGSYYLYVRATTLLAQMQSERPVATDIDRTPFSLAQGIEGCWQGNVLLERVAGSDAAFIPVTYRAHNPDIATQEQCLGEYRALMRKPMRERIAEEMGVALAELPKEEQVFFLEYMTTVQASDVEELRAFCHTYGTVGIRSFLSLEHGGVDMGKVILAIATRYTSEDAMKVFDAYAVLVETARRAQVFVYEQLGEEKLGLAEAVEQALLARGKTLLQQAAVHTQSVETFLASLTTLEARAEVLKAVIHTEHLTGDIEQLQLLRDVNLAQHEARSVLQNDALLQEMEDMYRANHAARGEAFVDAIVARFKDRLADDASLLHVLTYIDELEACLLEQRIDEHTVELSALNTNPHFAFARAGFGLFAYVTAIHNAAGRSVVFDCPTDLVRAYQRHGCVQTGSIVCEGVELALMRKDPLVPQVTNVIS
jgi:hypothetical protein